MAKHGKRYNAAAKAAGLDDHAPDSAVALAKEFSEIGRASCRERV